MSPRSCDEVNGSNEPLQICLYNASRRGLIAVRAGRGTSVAFRCASAKSGHSEQMKIERERAFILSRVSRQSTLKEGSHAIDPWRPTAIPRCREIVTAKISLVTQTRRI